MKIILGYDKKLAVFERAFNDATKFKRELPTEIEMATVLLTELSCLAEDIHAKTREATDNDDPDMQEFLWIDKALQNKKDELKFNTSKLT